MRSRGLLKEHHGVADYRQLSAFLTRLHHSAETYAKYPTSVPGLPIHTGPERRLQERQHRRDACWGSPVCWDRDGGLGTAAVVGVAVVSGAVVAAGMAALTVAATAAENEDRRPL